ncbi:pyridoxal phosphate-dependent aminotransferase [Aureivirga sp. CE67]|uniref:pyridoxal phosphate-dependent aminotransferase n=1 Tax=Aureivirga sp. CE67 TaxID=1788983 RepID=UPI0018C96673|nr:histidinol-phosphate transaminase [Aureivirga sp. CE67]
MIHGHGDDLYKYKTEIKANFSSNVYAKGISETLKKYLESSISKVQNYPNPEGNDLQRKIEQFYSLSENNAVVTNGATEAFYLIAHIFQRKKALILTPTFAEYESSCSIFDLEMHFQDRKQFTGENIQEDLVFICNPNNPTGEIFSISFIEKILKENPKTYFVLDEAYTDFCEEEVSVLKLLSTYSNLILVKSLTKVFAIPGLRLGFILCSERIQKRILGKKMPWSVNALALDAGKYIFDHFGEIKKDFQVDFEAKKSLEREIQKIKGFEVLPTKTNYFLVKMKEPKVFQLKEELVNQHQILIRNASNFRGLDAHYFRIASQSEAQNQLLIQALKEWSFKNF